jgi:hypothetical protein
VSSTVTASQEDGAGSGPIVGMGAGVPAHMRGCWQ